MSAVFDNLLRFQETLVYLALAMVPVAGVLIGFGLIVATSAPVFGYRLQRLGLQLLGAILLVLLGHAIAIGTFGADVPVVVILLIYGVAGLLVLHPALNLFFGPKVGNAATTKLLTSLILLVLGVVFVDYLGLFGR